MTSGSRVERSSARVRRRFRVSLKHSPCFSVDIGAGGVCLEILRVLPPGSLIEGTVLVHDSERFFAGRVVWAKSGVPHLGLRGRMGVAFTKSDIRIEMIA